MIETDDKLKLKRDRSREQEHRISRESQFAHWRRSDVTKQDQVARGIGLLLLPLFGLWTLLAWVAIEVLLHGVFRPLGQLIGGKASLSTGAGPAEPAAAEPLKEQ